MICELSAHFDTSAMTAMECNSKELIYLPRVRVERNLTWLCHAGSWATLNSILYLPKRGLDPDRVSEGIAWIGGQPGCRAHLPPKLGAPQAPFHSGAGNHPRIGILVGYAQERLCRAGGRTQKSHKLGRDLSRQCLGFLYRSTGGSHPLMSLWSENQFTKEQYRKKWEWMKKARKKEERLIRRRKEGKMAIFFLKNIAIHDLADPHNNFVLLISAKYEFHKRGDLFFPTTFVSTWHLIKLH